VIRIIFITILFLSSNVFAATYLVCTSYDNIISIKLGNKKILVKLDTDDYVDYTDLIIEWNDEIIKLKKKPFGNFVLKSINSDPVEPVEPVEPVKKLVPVVSIHIDRVTGILKWKGDRYRCEVRKKTLF
jgi:hypothetical protein